MYPLSSCPSLNKIETQPFSSPITEKHWQRFFELIGSNPLDWPQEEKFEGWPREREAYSPWHVAAALGDEGLCQELVLQECNPNDQGKLPFPPLYLALFFREEDAATTLIQQSANLFWSMEFDLDSLQDYQGEPLYQVIIDRGLFRVLNFCFHFKYLDVNQGHHGATLLAWAFIGAAPIEMLKVLKNAGANLDKVIMDGGAFQDFAQLGVQYATNLNYMDPSRLQIMSSWCMAYNLEDDRPGMFALWKKLTGDQSSELNLEDTFATLVRSKEEPMIRALLKKGCRYQKDADYTQSEIWKQAIGNHKVRMQQLKIFRHYFHLGGPKSSPYNIDFYSIFHKTLKAHFLKYPFDGSDRILNATKFIPSSSGAVQKCIDAGQAFILRCGWYNHSTSVVISKRIIGKINTGRGSGETPGVKIYNVSYLDANFKTRLKEVTSTLLKNWASSKEEDRERAIQYFNHDMDKILGLEQIEYLPRYQFGPVCSETAARHAVEVLFYEKFFQDGASYEEKDYLEARASFSKWWVNDMDRRLRKFFNHIPYLVQEQFVNVSADLEGALKHCLNFGFSKPIVTLLKRFPEVKECRDQQNNSLLEIFSRNASPKECLKLIRKGGLEWRPSSEGAKNLFMT